MMMIERTSIWFATSAKFACIDTDNGDTFCHWSIVQHIDISAKAYTAPLSGYGFISRG